MAAIPALKLHEFILSPIEDEESIDRNEVIMAIKEFLESIDEARNFAVIAREEVILVKSLYGKTIERDQAPPAQMFSCSHCGFVTQYETEHQNHMKIHYL